MEDNVTVASILVQRNADINVVDDDMWTPLHTASACESVEIVQLLLEVSSNTIPQSMNLSHKIRLDISS